MTKAKHRTWVDLNYVKIVRWSDVELRTRKPKQQTFIFQASNDRGNLDNDINNLQQIIVFFLAEAKNFVN